MIESTSKINPKDVKNDVLLQTYMESIISIERSLEEITKSEKDIGSVAKVIKTAKAYLESSISSIKIIKQRTRNLELRKLCDDRLTYIAYFLKIMPYIAKYFLNQAG